MLKEKLQQDVKDALKAGDSKKRMVIGGIMSAIKNRELDKRARLSKAGTDLSKLDEESRLNEEEILEVIVSEAKKRKESIESFKSGGREDLAKGEEEELQILMLYMPEQLTGDQIREEVKRTMSETGISDTKGMGKLIGAVMAKVKGKADGTLVSKIVKEELGQ